jgi:hypothetical protein
LREGFKSYRNDARTLRKMAVATRQSVLDPCWGQQGWNGYPRKAASTCRDAWSSCQGNQRASEASKVSQS